MKLNDIIRALDICLVQNNIDTSCCAGCPLFGHENCKKVLVDAAADKLNSMRNLLDDSINHHYYDTLEEYQEENAALRDQLQQIEAILVK